MRAPGFFATSRYLIVVTRSTSAADVTKERHFATASSIMVVMPLDGGLLDHAGVGVALIRPRTGSVISRHSNTPERPR